MVQVPSPDLGVPLETDIDVHDMAIDIRQARAQRRSQCKYKNMLETLKNVDILGIIISKTS